MPTIFYKVFCSDKKLYTLLQGNRRKPLPKRKWLDERDYRDSDNGEELITERGSSYPFGWHLFTSKKAAKRYFKGATKIFRVEAKDIHTFGEQFIRKGTKRVRCFVAKRIKICEEIK